MAPSTRLREQPARRVDYRQNMAAGRVGSTRDPILIGDTPPPQEKPKHSAKTKQKAVSKPVRASQGRFTKSESPTNAKSGRSKVAKSAPPPKEQKPRPNKTECTICATTKNTKRGFRASSLVDTCEHFESICDLCIQKQIKTRMAAHQLAEAHLPCMFPQCEIVLDHSALKKVTSKALFESWNTAVTKHLLATDPSYIACLNSECGVYFSAEGCGSKHEIDIGNGEGKGKSKAKNDDSAVKAVCPHCDHELCLSCKRPWHLGSCNSARKKEDEESEKAIKNMGAKQCPKCGVNIEKQGGCDHMTCKTCRHNFCWECLGAFTGNANNHAETCSHRRPMIAQDVGNWVPDNLNEQQINGIIERAERERAAGRIPQNAMQLPPVHGAQPPPLHPQAQAWAQVQIPPQGGNGNAPAAPTLAPRDVLQMIQNFVRQLGVP
ncbi:hypothetical protein B5807_10214 [Epicoccum nigrum]|uniref:RBR-type E3 ubiquitin transferase n=1 Tax=Epicoccum nigrum TaxID=105696 RepID=A0A1Y2LNB1_EPING|nr:hypothetical protein B5807_10214 [Epicoccum nigrum]